LGPASVDLSGVATGRVGLFLQCNLHPWDWFPGAALVLGAGGAIREVPIGGNTWQLAGNLQAVADAEQTLLRAAG
jgi:fructose-1,6-bisphosphatase/inositol monophosphatase family enzyme